MPLQDQLTNIYPSNQDPNSTGRYSTTTAGSTAELNKFYQYIQEATVHQADPVRDDPYVLMYYQGDRYHTKTCSSTEEALKVVGDLKKTASVTDIQLFERVDRWQREWAKK